MCITRAHVYRIYIRYIYINLEHKSSCLLIPKNHIESFSHTSAHSLVAIRICQTLLYNERAPAPSFPRSFPYPVSQAKLAILPIPVISPFISVAEELYSTRCRTGCFSLLIWCWCWCKCWCWCRCWCWCWC